MRSLIKSATVAGAVPLLVLALAGPSAASDRWTYRSTSTSAFTQWIEFGALPGGVEGNVHVGYLGVNGGSYVDVWGEVTDWTCPEGELPPEGGGHGEEEEEPETNCVLHSTRFVYGDNSEVAFSVDRRLNTAKLTGILTVENHDGGLGGRPPVSITWTGVGALNNYSYTGKESDGTSSYYWKETGVRRDAVIADGSFIGAMGFTDDADDTSSGALSSGKYYERQVSQ